MVGAQLMGWQFSTGYFGFYSFYMLGGCNGVAGESSSSGISDVRGGVAPRTGFFGVYWDRVMLHTCFFLGHDAPRMGPNLEIAHCFWAGPHIIN